MVWFLLEKSTNSLLIYSYIDKIVSTINKYLVNIKAELEWRIYRSKGVIALLFLTKYINDPVGIDYESKDNRWR